uniref:MI domain-containing protein n=2 Tax=Parascaris univalens TaxID=6257 RepID=A0A915BSB1_PARUN
MGIGANVLSITCKRREARRERKKLKKLQKAAYATHKKVEDVVAISFSQGINESNQVDVNKHPLRRAINDGKEGKKRRRRKRTTSASRLEKRRKDEVKRSIEEDEAEIKRYATLLGYKKRKSTKIPQVFRAEGLDYLLELCDPVKDREDLAEESEQSQSDVEEFDEEHMAAEEIDLNEDTCNSDADVRVKQKVRRVSFADTPQVYPQENESEVSANKSALKCDGKKGLKRRNVQGSKEDCSDESCGIKEDIYGRLVDRKTGEIVSKGANAEQRLLDLKMGSCSDRNEERKKLEKNLRGIINRLNENTIVSSVKSVGDMFASYAHNDVKEVLFDALYKSAAVGYRLPDRILIEYALFIALLHSTVSVEISSYFVENFILRFVGVISSPPDDKSLENISVLLAEIYNFKVIKASMVKEILHRLEVVISDKLLECSKLILSYSGAVMKSRDSDVLQKCVSDIHIQLSRIPKERHQEQHLRFLVEEFMAIKNANIRKWTDAVDRTLLDHYISIFRGLTKKVGKETELGMSVDDIEHIAERGRWWLVGSAWQPAMSANTASPSICVQQENTSKFDHSLLTLARKARMNTTLRRNIFCTLLSSQDEVDAFERLMRLSLKGQQEREIIHICVHCALREPSYNPFYAAVLKHFCAFHKRFKLTMQYALWDRIRELNKLQTWQRPLLAAVIADLILNKSIGITVLKVCHLCVSKFVSFSICA